MISLIFLLILQIATAFKRTILLNAIDDIGLHDAITFISKVEPMLKDQSCSIILYLQPNIPAGLKGEVERGIKGVKEFKYYSSKPYKDQSITRPEQSKQKECVSYILEALQSTISSMGSGQLLSLAFRTGFKFLPTATFMSIFVLHAPSHSISLLSKTKSLTSVSDWRDLAIVAMNVSNDASSMWLSVFSETFHHHANRESFTVLEPRVAMMEATLRLASRAENSDAAHGSGIGVTYFSTELQLKPYDAPPPLPASLFPMISVHCQDREHDHCILNEPMGWLLHVERTGIPSKFIQRVNGDQLKEDDLADRLPHGMWDGSLRFFNPSSSSSSSSASASSKPSMHVNGTRKMCWESRTSPAAAMKANRGKVLHRHDRSEPVSTTIPLTAGPKKITAVLLTSMEASAMRLDQKMYINLSKQYYAQLHNYKFLQLSSNQYRHYYEASTFASMPPDGNKEFLKGFMSKIPMVITALMSNHDSEWLLWTDDDVYLNPLWTHVPLDVFLQDVPETKVFVAGTYRSAFTNIFLIRNSAAGRRLAIDWLAVAQSGHIQCHGFDQAALQTLIILRISKSMNNPAPFNHTCLWTNEGDIGCNNKGDWSCDFDFERTMYFTGFKTAMNSNFFDLRLSSYTKGCANDVIPDFHIIAETSTRPRLQCGHCTRLNEVFSSGHWDGPLGGGNDKYRRGGINGYFSNHKAEFLFWEGYLNESNCVGVPDFVPLCADGNHTYTGIGAGRGKHRHGHSLPREITSASNTPTADFPYKLHLVSLVDGYAFDLLAGSYCRVTDPVTLAYQRAHTYMQDYPMLLKYGSLYSVEKWNMAYRNFSGGEGRAPCNGVFGPNTHCDHGEGEDGQKLKAAITSSNEHEYFERENYCGACVTVTRPEGRNSPAVLVVDCRLDSDVIVEKKNNQSQLQDVHDVRKGLWSQVKEVRG